MTFPADNFGVSKSPTKLMLVGFSGDGRSVTLAIVNGVVCVDNIFFLLSFTITSTECLPVDVLLLSISKTDFFHSFTIPS